MSGWLDLTPLGLAPNQKHQALLGAPKIVHCGLTQDSIEAVCHCVPNYCARKFWKKLSISVVGLKRKLRRLSSVGSLRDLMQGLNGGMAEKNRTSLVTTEILRNKTLERTPDVVCLFALFPDFIQDIVNFHERIQECIALILSRARAEVAGGGRAGG